MIFSTYPLAYKPEQWMHSRIWCIDRIRFLFYLQRYNYDLFADKNYALADELELFKALRHKDYKIAWGMFFHDGITT